MQILKKALLRIQSNTFFYYFKTKNYNLSSFFDNCNKLSIDKI